MLRSLVLTFESIGHNENMVHVSGIIIVSEILIVSYR